jgi:hypothetical protein
LKIRGNIRSSRCTTIDTGGKLTAGVVDTGGNLPPVSLTSVENLQRWPCNFFLNPQILELNPQSQIANF